MRWKIDVVDETALHHLSTQHMELVERVDLNYNRLTQPVDKISIGIDSPYLLHDSGQLVRLRRTAVIFQGVHDLALNVVRRSFTMQVQ